MRADLLAEIDAMISQMKKMQKDFIIVSNEVGLGLVPEYPLGRLYRDLLGEVNQKMAAFADEVIFMVSGIPMKLKIGGMFFCLRVPGLASLLCIQKSPMIRRILKYFCRTHILSQWQAVYSYFRTSLSGLYANLLVLLGWLYKCILQG